jgi:putative MATE family efflux protein
MTSNLISQLQMLIDKIFLGRLDLKCMSAVGNASSPIWTTMTTIFSMTVGGTILVSQAIGAGEEEKARKMMASVFKYNNVLSVFWFVFWMLGAQTVFTLMDVDDSIIDMSVAYARIYAPVFLITGLSAAIMSMLQVSEKTNIMITYGVVRSVINIILDYILIFGRFGLPRMEVAGAALATTIAEFAGGTAMVVYVLVKKNLRMKPRLKEILDSKLSMYFQAIKKGMPAAMDEFAWNFGNLYLIAMLNQVSAVAAGVYSIVFSVELIPTTIVSALGSATLTLSGQETGRKNYKGVKHIVATAMTMSVMVAIAILICLRMFPRVIMGLFTTDTTVIVAAAVYLTIVGIDMLPKSANIIIGAGIRGYGDTMWMLKTQILGTIFVIAGSSVLVLGLGQGMTALFWLVVADETLRCTLNYLHLRRVTR